MSDIRTFRVEVSDAVTQDLRTRLARVRWPQAETVTDWSQGIPLAYMRELCDYWAESYDMQRVANILAAYPQFQIKVAGLDVSFLHVRSAHEGATPLVLSHGWPGSVLEYVGLIDALVDPESHGGSARDAFHVVCPSLPGFFLSGKPETTGWGVERTARAWSELMARLGYERYAACGVDWGHNVTVSMGQQDPDHLTGIHVTQTMLAPDTLERFGELTEQERSDQARFGDFAAHDMGYYLVQSTRPQTLAYGLSDSPAAQCAWVLEKFWSWSDCEGHPENAFSRDALLDNVMTYWLGNAGGSSARSYWENAQALFTTFEPVSVPTAVTIFPKDTYRWSRRAVETRFSDLRYYNRPEVGGHFPSYERPAVYLEELRSGFRAIAAQAP